MSLVYDESVRGSGYPATPISEWSSERVMRTWATHVENRAYLAFIYANGTFSEKAQAAAELKICERKLAFWERTPQFDRAESKRVIDGVKAKWAGANPKNMR